MLRTFLYSLVGVQALHIKEVPEIPNVLSSFISKVNKLSEKLMDLSPNTGWTKTSIVGKDQKTPHDTCAEFLRDQNKK